MYKAFKIKQAAAFVGVSENALRWMEKQGKVNPKRNRVGHRVYEEEDLERLKTENLLKGESFSKKILCPICKTNPRKNSRVRGQFGDHCEICHRQLVAQKRKSDSEIKKRICIRCGLSFVVYHALEQCCRLCKELKSNIKSNEKWLNPKEVRKPNGSAVAYSFFKKKYSVPNNVFRG